MAAEIISRTNAHTGKGSSIYRLVSKLPDAAPPAPARVAPAPRLTRAPGNRLVIQRKGKHKKAVAKDGTKRPKGDRQSPTQATPR